MNKLLHKEKVRTRILRYFPYIDICGCFAPVYLCTFSKIYRQPSNGLNIIFLITRNMPKYIFLQLTARNLNWKYELKAILNPLLTAFLRTTFIKNCEPQIWPNNGWLGSAVVWKWAAFMQCFRRKSISE